MTSEEFIRTYKTMAYLGDGISTWFDGEYVFLKCNDVYSNIELKINPAIVDRFIEFYETLKKDISKVI